MSRNFLHLGLSLLLVGCFEDSGPEEGSPETGTETADSSSAEEPESSSGDDETDATSGVDETSGDASSSEETESSGTGTEEPSSSGTETFDPGNSSGDDCDEDPVEVPIDEPFTAGESRTIYLDFDVFPGNPGEDAEFCLTFTSNNGASSRYVTINGKLMAFGPCGGQGPPPGPFEGCGEFVKPEGVAEILIDNTATPGCQSGSMDDVVLSFGC